MKIDLPTWAEVAETVEDFDKTDRKFGQRTKLNPVEQFIYDNEPSAKTKEWRESFTDALENAYLHETL